MVALLWRLRWLITVSEFGFWVALGQPVTDGIKDGQASHENGDAREDLKTAMCGLRASLAGGRQKENQTERIQAVIEPVSVVLPDREHERRGGKQVNAQTGSAAIATGTTAMTPTAVPIAFSRIRSRLPMRM